MPLSFAAESATPSTVPTDTPPGLETPTATALPVSTIIPSPTNSSGGITLPPGLPTNTQFAPANGSPLPPTLTFTPFRTPKPTFTPSITPTAISCNGITGVSHGPLRIRDNIMQMTIDNRTGHTLNASQIYVEWNHDTGHSSGNDASLHLLEILLASQTWNGNIHSPSAYITAFYPLIPPGESVIEFVFHQNYNLADGTERIIITIGTPGCVNYPIDSSH